MELSSPRFKAATVTIGFSIWFFAIASIFGVFSIFAFSVFAATTTVLAFTFAKKLSGALDIFAIFNTKLFLGILYILVFSVYGLLFKALRIDLLRLKKQDDTYWLEMEELKESRILKQY
jgi:hypothetical protein